MIRIPVDLREMVIALAGHAGQQIMQVYGRGFEVMHKDDASPVTEADLLANAILVDGLRRITPNLPVLSEESAQVSWEERQHWPSYWLVDPIDGTREFVKRNGQFSVNVALIHQGAPYFAVIQEPVTGTVWHATRGELAYRRLRNHDTALHVRAPATAPLQVAISRSTHNAEGEAMLARMGQVQTVRLGSSLKLCWLAEGRLDAYPRLGPTSEWDTAAGQCILQAAGGNVLSLATGKPFRYNRRPSLLNGPFIALGDLALPWRQWLDDPAA
ncbi:MAG: 3'(2'),5'-bisphosphate nucleotidase CysQ [Stenotrophomonas sp.]